MRLDHLYYLKAVEKYGSVNKAAQALFISQPALRSSIVALEKELGFPIIRSNSKGIIFTDLGKIVLDETQSVIETIERWKALSTPDGNMVHVPIKISAFHLAASIAVFDLVNDFKNDYDYPELYLQQNDAATAIEQLKDGLCQFAVISAHQSYENEILQKLNPSKYELHKLCEDELVPIFNVTNPICQQSNIENNQLYALSFVGFSEYEMYPYSSFSNHIANHVNRIYLDNVNNILRFIQTNASAYSLLSQEYFHHKVISRSIDLEQLCVYDQSASWHFGHYLLCLKDMYLSHYEQLFKKMLLSNYQSRLKQ